MTRRAVLHLSRERANVVLCRWKAGDAHYSQKTINLALRITGDLTRKEMRGAFNK